MPDGIGFNDALYLAGKSGKLNVITTEFDWKDKYNIWSGLIGGFSGTFLFRYRPEPGWEIYHGERQYQCKNGLAVERIG
jgi:hypothetical protein